MTTALTLKAPTVNMNLVNCMKGLTVKRIVTLNAGFKGSALHSGIQTVRKTAAATGTRANTC
jgi:hypothetical protein